MVQRFVDRGATAPDRAVSYSDLGLDCSERLFARDSFQSLLRCGDIVRVNGAYYLARVRSPEKRGPDRSKL